MNKSIESIGSEFCKHSQTCYLVNTKIKTADDIIGAIESKFEFLKGDVISVSQVTQNCDREEF